MIAARCSPNAKHTRKLRAEPARSMRIETGEGKRRVGKGGKVCGTRVVRRESARYSDRVTVTSWRVLSATWFCAHRRSCCCCCYTAPFVYTLYTPALRHCVIHNGWAHRDFYVSTVSLPTAAGCWYTRSAGCFSDSFGVELIQCF